MCTVCVCVHGGGGVTGAVFDPGRQQPTELRPDAAGVEIGLAVGAGEVTATAPHGAPGLPAIPVHVPIASRRRVGAPHGVGPPVGAHRGRRLRYNSRDQHGGGRHCE